MVVLTPADFELMRDVGLVTFAENPWANPDSKLFQIAMENGYEISFGKVLKKTPKWAKARMHYDGMSSRQLQVLKTAVEAIKNAPRDEKGKMLVHPTVVIQEAFKNWVSVAKPRERKDLERTLKEINRALAKAQEREARKEAVAAEATARRRPLAVA
jgi:hypothetical protein